MDNTTADYARAVFEYLIQRFPKVWGKCKYSTNFLGGGATRYRLFSSTPDTCVTYGSSYFQGYAYHEVILDHTVKGDCECLLYTARSIYEDTGNNSSTTYPVDIAAVKVDMSKPSSETAQQIATEILESLHANAAQIEDVPNESFVHACDWHAKQLYSVSPEQTGG